MLPKILQPYTILVDFLAQALGPDYEIALQDLTSEEHAIVAIANNHISGRRVGSPLTDAALQMLKSKAYESNEFLTNYKGISEDGRLLRSSTMFIKDENDTPVGLLCINFDASRYADLSRKLLSIVHPESFIQNASFETESDNPLIKKPAAPSITENFPIDISALMQKIFTDCTASLETPVDRLTQHERREVIAALNNQGFFQLKGAIAFLSKKLSCSPATLYRCLNEISE